MTTAALAVPGSNRAFVRSLLVASFLTVGIGVASAQSPPAAAPQAPPISVSGWSYKLDQRSGSDVHIFRCEQPSCGAGSKVTYRLYAADNPMTLDQFRESQTQIIKALEQRKPGQRITLIGVDGSKATAPRMFRARRLTVTPDGASEYQVNGLLFGTRASASLISSARDEKASNDNYAKFAAAVMHVLAPKTR